MKIICSGPNYLNHFEGKELPLEPQFFVKTVNAVCKDGAIVQIPDYSTYLLGEAELVLVIGQTCSKVSAGDAMDYVSHYTIANDVTAPEVTGTDLQWLRAKCADGFCPLGAYIAGKPHENLLLRTFLNNALQQEFSVAEMVFKPAELVSYISQFMQLEKGDIILTGSKKGAVKIASGDIVRVTIEDTVYCENKFI